MPQYCPKFNPDRDIKRVSPIGALDLKSAYANNAVPANLQSSEAKFNGIDDPASIGARVTDTIDATVMERQIRDYKPPKDDNNE